MSIPLAATSVQIKKRTLPSLNAWRLVRRSCIMPERVRWHTICDSHTINEDTRLAKGMEHYHTMCVADGWRCSVAIELPCAHLTTLLSAGTVLMHACGLLTSPLLPLL